jgi:hypothetical protein
MKKYILIISVLLFSILGYMIFAGIVKKNVQQNVQKKIADLTNHGFDIDKTKKDGDRDHYVLTFKDMRKITPFIQSFYGQLSTNTIHTFKDMQIALDIQNDYGIFDDIKIEVYPIKLSKEIENSLKKEELEMIEQHLEQKTVILYLSLDTSLSNVKGHLKDIDIKGMKRELKIKGNTFNAQIKDGKIITYEENIQEFALISEGKSIINFLDIYTEKFASEDELDKRYLMKVKTFFMASRDDNITINDLDIDLSWTTSDETLDASLEGNLASLTLNTKEQKRAFDSIVLDINMKNINRTLISKIDKNKIKSIDEFGKLLRIKNPIITINTFEITKIKQGDRETEGFQIEGEIRSDASKSRDQDIYKSLMINGKLTLSKSLFELLSQNPSMDILFILIPQEEKENYYIFDIYYDDTLTVNKERIL